MNRLEHLLTVTSEECNEVGQRASKIARFGLYDIQPGHEKDNVRRFLEEYADLIGAIEMLQDEIGPTSVLDDEEFFRLKEAKKKKVEQFLKFSELRGTLCP